MPPMFNSDYVHGVCATATAAFIATDISAGFPQRAAGELRKQGRFRTLWSFIDGANLSGEAEAGRGGYDGGCASHD